MEIIPVLTSCDYKIETELNYTNSAWLLHFLLQLICFLLSVKHVGSVQMQESEKQLHGADCQIRK